MSIEYLIVFICSLLSLIYGGYTINQILQAPDGSDKMKEIALAIQEGAQAYLNRQYITISIVGILIAILLFYLMENTFVSIFDIISKLRSRSTDIYDVSTIDCWCLYYLFLDWLILCETWRIQKYYGRIV